MGVWLKQLPASQKPRQIASEGQKKWLHIDHLAPPPNRCNTIQTCLLEASSFCRKREPRCPAIPPRTVSYLAVAPTLILHRGDYQEIYGAQPLGIQEGGKQRRGKGLIITSTWILVDQVRICSGQSSNPNQGHCSSAEPRQRHTLTRELDRVQICLICILE